ncbi:hypothetical protein [Halorhabdus sp. CUG00001]|nr:hypothetical protein [Halorhabdus sp. CUG00001]
MAGMSLGQKAIAVFVTVLLNVVLFVFGGFLGILFLIPSILLVGTLLVRF